MKERSLLPILLALLPLSGELPAEVVGIPKEAPAVTAIIPDDWKPAKKGTGVECNAPDFGSTMFLEVTTEADLKQTIGGKIKWLEENQRVVMEPASKETKEFEINGLKWKRLAWEGDHEHMGRVDIGLAFANVGGERVLTITCWSLKKDHDRQLEVLAGILDSIAPVPATAPPTPPAKQ